MTIRKFTLTFFALMLLGSGLNFACADEEPSKGKVLPPQNPEMEIVVVANEKNPLKALTLRQVKQIFLGRLRRFPEINTEMAVADREDSSALHFYFYRRIIKMDPARLKRYRARYLFSGQGRLPKVVMSSSAMEAFVKSNKNAIGFLELAKKEALPKGLKVLYRVDKRPDKKRQGS